MGMDNVVSLSERRVSVQTKWVNLWSVAVYLVWSLAIYLLESWDNLRQQLTILGRFSDVLIANGLIGIIGAFWMVQLWLNSHLTRLKPSGFQLVRPTLLIIVTVCLIGVAYLLILKPVIAAHPVTKTDCNLDTIVTSRCSTAH